jgi:hypothetical protein
LKIKKLVWQSSFKKLFLKTVFHLSVLGTKKLEQILDVLVFILVFSFGAVMRKEKHGEHVKFSLMAIL